MKTCEEPQWPCAAFSEWRSPGPFAMLLLLLFGLVQNAVAVTYYVATDVPATLGGSDYTPNQLLRRNDTAYVLEDVLPFDGQIGALHRRSDGVWLFSPAFPVAVSGVNYQPRDILAYDGVFISMMLDGAANGIPTDARIDALYLDSSGSSVLSFDVPVRLGGVEYGRSDLVRLDTPASFTLAWDAEGAGVPDYANVVGAALDSSGGLVITFDVPTRLGAVDFLPGELVKWDGFAFSLYASDPAWPQFAQLRDFAFLPASGAVPDGGAVPGVPLTIELTGSSGITLSWGAACAGGVDYEVYEGTIGAYYSHVERTCTTGGGTSSTFPAPSGSAYYLVVPRTAISEGSYGRASSGTERPRGADACLPQEIAFCP